MASFLDNVPQFNPYIAQLPVEAMVKVGTTKQEQYDQGVEKIQKAYDTIGGLKVSQDIHKAYLQQKINDIQKNVSLAAIGDLSNSQLVNSTSSEIMNLANDKFVQIGVSNTARYQKELARLEKAREEGKSSPANEEDFYKQSQKALNTLDLGKSYNAKYNEFFDKEKFFKEMIKDTPLASVDITQIYKKDAYGNDTKELSHYGTRIKEEGYNFEQLNSILSKFSSDPRVQLQLEIEGKYNNKNKDQVTLGSEVTALANQQKELLEDQIDSAYLQKTLSNDNDAKDKIQDEIDRLKNKLKFNTTKLNNYTDLINSNPEAARAQIYKDKILFDYEKQYGARKTTKEYIKSEPFEAEFKISEAARDQRNFDKRLTFDIKSTAAKLKQDAEIARGNQAIEMLKLQKKTKEEREEEEAARQDGKEYTEDNKKNNNNSILTENLLTNSAKEFNSSQVNLVWATLYQDNPKKKILLDKEVLLEKYANIENKDDLRTAAIEAILSREAKTKGTELYTFLEEKTIQSTRKLESSEGKRSLANKPLLKGALKNFIAARGSFAEHDALQNNAFSDNNVSYKKVLNSEVMPTKTFNFKGKKVKFTNEDANNFAVAIKAEQEGGDAFKVLGKQAMKKIIASGKLELFNNFDKISTPGQLRRLTTIKLRTKPQYYGVNEGDIKLMETLQPMFNKMKKLDKKIVEKDVAAVNRYISTNLVINPNVTAPLLTGTRKDAKLEIETRAILGDYSANQLGLGPGHNIIIKNFKLAKTAEDFKNLNLSKKIKLLDSGVIQHIIADDAGNEHYITADEAKKINLSTDKAYKINKFNLLESVMNSNNGTSTKGNLDSKETYEGKYSVFTEEDFPLVANSGYSVKVHFQSLGGKVYPSIYLQNPDGEYAIIPIDGVPKENLEDFVTNSLSSKINMNTITKANYKK